jgi:hypothetical protein
MPQNQDALDKEAFDRTQIAIMLLGGLMMVGVVKNAGGYPDLDAANFWQWAALFCGPWGFILLFIYRYSILCLLSELAMVGGALYLWALPVPGGGR